MASVPFKSTAISGSIERTTADTSYLVAGSNVTIATGSGGQITISAAGGGGSPGGSDTHVQFNSNGAFAGSTNLTFNSTGSADSTGLLTLTGSIAVLSGNAEGGINFDRGAQSIAAGTLAFSNGAGSFAHGVGSGNAGVASGSVVASGLGTFVQGYSKGNKVNVQGSFPTYTITTASILVKAYGAGNFAQGFAKIANDSDSGFVGIYSGFADAASPAAFKGTFAQGYTNDGNISAAGFGSFSQGFTTGSYRGIGSGPGGTNILGGAIINAVGNGSFSQGASIKTVDTSSATSIVAGGGGSFAQGGSLDGYLTAGSPDTKGTFVQGYVSGSSTRIIATAQGSFAQGSANTVIGSDSYQSRISAGANQNLFGIPRRGLFSQGASEPGDVVPIGYPSAQYTRVSSDGAGGFAQGAGVSGSQIVAQGYGTFAQGYTTVTGSIGTNYGSFSSPLTAKGTFAQGYAKRADIYVNSKGCFAQGYTFGYDGTNSGDIKATSPGSFAQGIAVGNSSNASYIRANGPGSFAQGYGAYGILASNTGSLAQGYDRIKATGKSSLAQGSTKVYAVGRASFAQGDSLVESGDNAFTNGSFAQGYSSVKAGQDGTLAQGRTNILASGEGSFSQGHTNVTGSGQGSFAQGRTNILASGNGSFAQGHTNIAGSSVGSFAQGYNTVAASGAASFAQGSYKVYATQGGSFARGLGHPTYTVSATGLGSFVNAYLGFSATESALASGAHSVQFGPGTNSVNQSIQVGSKTPGVYDAKAIRIASNLTSGGDVGDITTQRKVLAPDGTQAPGSTNETKLVMSGSTVEKHAGVGNFADGEFAGEIMYIGGGSVTAGLVYYLANGGSWTLASGDASSAMSGSLVGMAIDTGNVTDKGILLRGFYKLPAAPNTGSYTIGAAMFVSTGSDGYVIDSPPGGSGQIVRIVGHNVTNKGLLWFNPDGNYIINS